MPIVIRRPKVDTLLAIGPFGNANYAMLSGALERARYSRGSAPWEGGGDVPQFSMPETPHNVATLERCVGDVVWECDAREKIAAFRAVPLYTAVESAFPMKTEAWKHQIEDLKRSATLPGFAYFWEMGLGKTKEVIDNASYLYSIGEIDLLVVSAPNGVHLQWVTISPDPDPETWGELQKHCAVPWRGHLYRSGWGKRAQAAFNTDLLTYRNGLLVLAVNTEGLSSLKLAKFVNEVVKSRRTMFALDESQMIKSPGAQRTKYITGIGRNAKFRRIMSGTPDPQGVHDLFTQMRFLSPNILGMNTFGAFKAEFCIMGGFENRQIVGYNNQHVLTERMAPFVSVRYKKDCMDLPEKIYARRLVEMVPEQKRLYQEVARQLKDYIEEPTFEIHNALHQLGVLRQITGGFMPETGEMITDASILAVVDICENNPGRKIVWACYTAEIQAIVKYLQKAGHKVFPYYGEIKRDERADGIRQWKGTTDGIIVANPAAGGRGGNWDRAPNAIYYSHSFNAEHRWQSEDRNHRGTTTESPTYTDIIRPGSTDARIVASLRRKKGVADMTAGALRDWIRGLYTDAG